MALRHSITIVLAAISLATAQNSPYLTRTNPVQPPGFSDDPALSTPRPLVIITPGGVIDDDTRSTSDSTLTPETTVPFQDEAPIETTTTTKSAVPSTLSSPFATSTSSPRLTPSPTAAITTASSTTTTTAAGETTTTTITDDADAQAASTSTDLSPIPFIGPRFVKRSAVSSMANPASMPTAFASAAAGLIAIVGLAMAL
ncbi:uncharacterized protein TrAFT101_003423 [Trichoderma asperellum]|uniref:Mid2 domain-containing protein n=1 Tax=Trichoderma asperellum (strain ATCC 204424 / CBS 433.97 / NBRC 101777) TaxID=1042311 RepID=A0A2T3ZQQ9_TRIA4|nr:hypothetical protein M441DRAFT_23055 [Trichoderma asperellum CBS 433.97]PTB47142.1 hypothetical protein M441DRAFT_23055 [Trichoderma asperellum CBS 433.97]UKZ87646.1 hypothetical protein TrAFT101_003423 [Trichoderma asperellum]